MGRDQVEQGADARCVDVGQQQAVHAGLHRALDGTGRSASNAEA